MGIVAAGITTSVDGYIVGPDDGPGRGLGIGGERLHAWVFGGPWHYDAPSRGTALPEDASWLDAVMANVGAVVGGRWTYEAADHWGDRNPWGLPFFIVTHRPEDQPPGDDFKFVHGIENAVEQARAAAGGKGVHIMGGGDVIRQALMARLVDELTLIIAPLVLGGGKRLFDGFTDTIELEHRGVRQSRYATFIDYRVLR